MKKFLLVVTMVVMVSCEQTGTNPTQNGCIQNPQELSSYECLWENKNITCDKVDFPTLTNETWSGLDNSKVFDCALIPSGNLYYCQLNKNIYLVCPSEKY